MPIRWDSPDGLRKRTVSSLQKRMNGQNWAQRRFQVKRQGRLTTQCLKGQRSSQFVVVVVESDPKFAWLNWPPKSLDLQSLRTFLGVG